MTIDTPANVPREGPPAFTPGLLAIIWAHLDQLNASPELRAYFKEAIKGPSRSVRSTPRSMSGRYPSRKMGASIAFESATLEMATILALENDPDVLFYLEQPPKLKMVYRHHGRNRAYLYTPDFLVIRHSSVGLIECKRKDVVEQRASNDSELFVERDGRWGCPPAERAAAVLGISHELWTEYQLNATSLSNTMFLGHYLGADQDIPGYDAALKQIKGTLDCLARASIQSILDKCSDKVTPDHIYLAVGRGDVAIDWQDSRIRDAQRCYLYRDEETLRSYVACAQTMDTQRSPVAAQVVLAPGRSVSWDGQVWRILSIGASEALLECNGRSEQFPLSVLRDLVHRGKLQAAAHDVRPKSIENHVDAVIRRARKQDLETANDRLDLIRPYLQERRASPRHRTVRRYLSQYKRALAVHGNGFIGLIPKLASSGNRVTRLMTSVVELAMEVTREHLLNQDNVRVKTGWGFLNDRCKSKGLPTPSLKWFSNFIRKLPAYQVARSRGGDKLAYDLEPRLESTELSVAMEPARAWQRGHIDHTLLDVETVFPGTTDNAGRVWVTLMIDHFSRRVLAVSLSYEPPSYRSVMAVIRECVRRWGRLPESLLLDGGKEFRGIWLQTLCSAYHVTLQYRPPTKPRYGSQIERLFGTLNTNLIHVIRGNTQLRKNVRQMTKAVDPDGFAIWSFSELYDVIEHYFFEVYDILAHRELLVSPRVCFERSIALSGHRPLQVIPYDRHFLLATCPSTRKGTARVQADGVKINYLYYSAPGLQAHFGKDVEVRYDPGNLGVAYAFIGREWVRLTCARHARLVWGLSERELQMITAEWRRQRSQVEKERLTDTILIKFLKQVNEKQIYLLERRQAAEERERLMGANTLPDDWDEPDEPLIGHKAVETTIDGPMPMDLPAGQDIVIKPAEFM